MTKLSIIIPVYNEVKTIKSIIEQVKAIDLKGVKKELIVIDDGSVDRTQDVLAKIQEIKFVVHEKNKGKGMAIRTGIKHATGDIIIIQDADLEYNPADYPAVLQPILNGETKVVFGSRFMPGAKKLTRNKLSRYKGNEIYYLGNKFLSFCVGLLYGRKITDMETCYKAFTADVIKNIPLKSQRFDFEPEITAKLLKRGHHIIEVPIRYTPRSFEEGKKITWKDGVKAAFCLVKYRFVD